MRSLRFWFLGCLLVTVLGFPGIAAAQQGTLTGRVTSVEDGSTVGGVLIQVLGAGQGVETLSNDQGMYEIALPAGTYSLFVTHLGFVDARFDRIRVETGRPNSFDIALTSNVLALDPVVVTVSRQEEKQTEAVQTVHVVGTMKIQERPVTTPVDHIQTAPGVDIITQGIQATNVVIRGFNNIFSGALHALTDYRLAGVPSLRVNLLHFIPSNNEDIDRMEVVLGPASALYGPNTANGVLHILTRSPLDPSSEGLTVTAGLGNQSVFQGSVRGSHMFSENFGVKLSGQYISGQEWEYTDPGEQDARDAADNNPLSCLSGLIVRGYELPEAEEACARVGVRDFDLSRYGFEARADYRFTEDGTAILTYGRTSATGIELTGLGAGQTEGWAYQFLQGRMNLGRFFAQGYVNTSDAGDGTFLLRDGVPLVDKSRLYVAQVQHGFGLFDDRQDFTYGADFYWTRPETEGTINGVYEEYDDIDEWGVYLQSKTALTPQLDLVLAGRVDNHSMIPEAVWSPRVGFVFSPVEDQSFRVTYNKAFSTPTSLNFFLDIPAGLAPNESLAALGFTVRAFGTGSDGYSFQNPDGSLHGMRSPFAPGQFLPADPSVMWPMLMGVLQVQAARGDLPPELAAFLPVLAGLSPTSEDIGIMLLDTSTGLNTRLEETTIPDVPGIRESYTETYEAGWQGVLADRFSLSADVYYTKKDNFISPLLTQNPLLLLNGPDVGAFITGPIVGAITQQLMELGLPYDQALAQAIAAAGTAVPLIAGGIASIPAGVAASSDIESQEADLIVTYRNIGNVDYWGADMDFSWFLNSDFTLNGTYSYISNDWFRIAQGSPISLNAPMNKGSLGLAYRSARIGFNAEARVRFTAEFPAESAGYVGTLCRADNEGSFFEGSCVGEATLVDLNMGYRIPDTRAQVQLAITNLFDRKYRSFVGVPYIGAFGMLKVKYDVF